MLFNSIVYLIFLPFVAILYFAIPHKYRWILLLVASYIFYMWWKVVYLLLIIFSTILDYIAGILMEKASTKKEKRIFLICSLAGNLGLLILFKYFNFLNQSFGDLLTMWHIPYNVVKLDILLPVGISFYTFQTLSYTIDVYRGHQKAERHLGKFALYVSFFPQLVAGPIERSTHLLPQMSKLHDVNPHRITNGCRLILWGFFKKVVVADNLAIVVNQVYNNVNQYNGPAYILATIFFAIQIYCDFSGYSEIAIGSARILGFDLMKNFNRPYFAKSIDEFWKRWHISLSTWFRDYLYIPLGGNRVVKWRWYMNLLITFIVSGIWHGANWTFVIWGLLHGVYLIVGILTKPFKDKFIKFSGLDRIPVVLKLIQITKVFILVNFGWIFFRANSFKDAIHIIKNLGNGLNDFFRNTLTDALFGFNLNPVIRLIDSLHIQKTDFWIIIFSLLVLGSVETFQRRKSLALYLNEKPVWFRWGLYISLIYMTILLGAFGNDVFIYFQF